MEVSNFVGRKRELNLLNDLFFKKKSNLVSVTGRFRIGKSALVKEFAKDKKLIVCSQSEDLLTLSNFIKNKEKGVLFLDELTQWKSLDLLFNQLPVLLKKASKVMVIISSSSPLWMMKNIFPKIDPCLKIHLEELSLAESNILLQNMGFSISIEEKIKLLRMTGGIPYYISLLQPKLSFIENTQQLCLKDELKDLFFNLSRRKTTIYQNILKVLARGPLEYLEIASLINYRSSGALSVCLQNLEQLGFVIRDYTWNLKTGTLSDKISVFRLKDNYLLLHLNQIDCFSSKELQMKNLILKNRQSIWHLLDLKKEAILREGPYFQHETLKQKACHIDYLIQTRHRILYACMIKGPEEELDSSITKRMKETLERLTLPKGFLCHPVLIHVSKLPVDVIESQFFFKTIHF